MTKIHYNYTVLKASVMGNLNGAIANLNDLNLTCASLGMPEGFEKADLVSAFTSTVSIELSNLKNVMTKLDNSEKYYTEAATTINTKVLDLDTYKLSDRKSRIKG